MKKATKFAARRELNFDMKHVASVYTEVKPILAAESEGWTWPCAMLVTRAGQDKDMSTSSSGVLKFENTKTWATATAGGHNKFLISYHLLSLSLLSSSLCHTYSHTHLLAKDTRSNTRIMSHSNTLGYSRFTFIP